MRRIGQTGAYYARLWTVLGLALLLSPLPAAAQSVILSQYPPGQKVAASSLSVVLASDQAAIVLGAGNANIGDVDVLTLPSVTVGTFPDNEPFNVAQLAGSSTGLAGAGIVGAATQRVTLASDDPAVVALQLIDNAISGAGFNITQLNGVNVSMGNGVSGTGVQRVTLASDGTGKVMVWDGTDTLLIDGSGNLAVSCSNCSGSGVSAIDNSAFVGGTNTVASMGAIFDTTPPTIADGSVGAPRMDSSRYLYAVFPSAQAVTVSSGSITADTELATAAAASDNFANPTAGGVLAFNMVWDGATWDRAASSLLTETAHDAALTPGSTTSPTTAFIAKDFDGLALPNAVSAENDQVLGAATLSGIQLMMLVSEDGSLQYGTATTPLVVGDGSGALNVICDSGCSGGTTYTVNAVAPADPVGTVFVLERDDALSALAEIEGDWTNPRSNANGALWVAVDGTIAATQSGTWNVTNISGTVSLPTGASTLAEQQTQTTALQLLDDIVRAEDDASADLHKGAVLLAVRDATPGNTSGTEGDYEPLQVNGGRLWVDASGVTLTVGSHAVTNAGTFAVQVDGAALTALQLIDDTVRLEDDAHSTGHAGNVVLGRRIDTLAASSGTSGDYELLNMAATGALYVAPTAAASGGATSHKRTSAGTTEDEHEVKASAGTLYSIAVTNTNAAARYLRCADNTAAGTTPGTTTPIVDLAIPGATAGAGVTTTFPVGLTFATGLTCWAVTGAADTDVAEVAANEIKFLYTFK